MPKGSRVLMADDDKMLIDMYKERLELAGYNVIVCHNGEEGLAQVKTGQPDIVLLDVMMPKLNGYEALASIKSDPQTKDIPVVMLSALMRDFNREKAIEAGADDYLIKSEAMPSDVITKIEQVLQKYGKGNKPIPGDAPKQSTPAVSPTPAAPATINHEEDKSAKPAEINKTEVPKIIFEPIKVEVSAQNPAVPAPVVPHNPLTQPAPITKTNEDVPVVTLHQNAQVHNPASVNSKPVQLSNEPKKSNGLTVLLIILVILLAILANNLIIYYFFLNK